MISRAIIVALTAAIATLAFCPLVKCKTHSPMASTVQYQTMQKNKKRK
jgi:hypothetical protein